MASVSALVDDFKEHIKFRNIMTWKYEENKLILTIYCLEKNIFVNKELDFLNFLLRKHSLAWMYNPFEVTEIISIRKNYSSHYIFISRKAVKKCLW